MVPTNREMEAIRYCIRMESTELNSVEHVNGAHANWMSQLVQCVKRAESVVVKSFKPTSANIGFIKSLSQDYRLFIRSWNDDLVLEKLAGAGVDQST